MADHAGPRVETARRHVLGKMREQPYKDHAGDDELASAAEKMADFVPATQNHLAQGGEAVGRQLEYERLIVLEAAFEKQRGGEGGGAARDGEEE